MLWVTEEAINSLPVFTEHVFSLSEDVFKDGRLVLGEYPLKVAKRLQDNKRTMRVGARDHFKSLSFYAHFMWKLYRARFIPAGLEAHYFSYSGSMAAYHTEKIKKAVRCNPFFSNLKDHKTQADSIISYSWDNQHFLTMEPGGLLEFKRGIHSPLIYVDDPLRDPENKLNFAVIDKINYTMRSQILDMAQDELHIVGTAQSSQDFYFDPDFGSRFNTVIEPAIIDREKRLVQWPEWVDFEELLAKEKERGPKVFSQEYQCTPVMSENSFVDPKVYDACVDPTLKNLNSLETENDVVAGFDIGKKQHPSHLAVFEVCNGKLKQIYSMFMDGWDYARQLEHLQTVSDQLKIQMLFYDNTRGEFEVMAELGELPACMVPVSFNRKSMHKMSAQLDRVLSNKDISFIKDERQRRLILSVTNDLKAPVTAEGHGDSFWSVCLALMYLVQGSPELSVY